MEGHFQTLAAKGPGKPSDFDQGNKIQQKGNICIYWLILRRKAPHDRVWSCFCQPLQFHEDEVKFTKLDNIIWWATPPNCLLNYRSKLTFNFQINNALVPSSRLWRRTFPYNDYNDSEILIGSSLTCINYVSMIINVLLKFHLNNLLITFLYLLVQGFIDLLIQLFWKGKHPFLSTVQLQISID